MLPEAARLQYLNAMGVSSWLPLPECTLPTGILWQEANDLPLANQADQQRQHQAQPQTGSTESLGNPDAHAMEGEFAPANEPPPLGMSVQQAQAQAAQMRTSLLADSANLDASLAPDAKPLELQSEPLAKTVQTTPKSAAEGERIEPLHLSFSWYSVGVLVVNEVPLQDGAAMTSSLAQLQTAMVNALNLGDKQVMPQAQGEFHWPLVPGLHGDHTRSGAQAALAYQLQKLLREKSVTKVMLLGQRSADLLMLESLVLGTVGKGRHWPEAKVLLTHSLHQLLKIPSNKAEAWSHMQSLLAD